MKKNILNSSTNLAKAIAATSPVCPSAIATQENDDLSTSYDQIRIISS